MREKDCGTEDGIEVFTIMEGNQVIERLEERLLGRYPVEDVKGKRGKILCRKDQMINSDIVKAIIDAGITKLKVRSVLACLTDHGVCSKCYGINLADGRPVNVGESVGTIAANRSANPALS